MQKKITNTSRDPHPFFFSRVARRNFLKYLFRAKRRETVFACPREARRKFFIYSREARRKFFEVPLSREAQRIFFCLSARSAEKNFYLFARSAENFFLTWPYYFLCRRPRTKLSPQVGRRLEQGWPYSAAPPGTSVLNDKGQVAFSIFVASKVFA